MKRVASIAVVGSRDALLFLRRNDNEKWTLPGGSIEEGEEPLAGAVRELFEETGLDVDDSDLEYLGCGIVDGKYKVYSYKYKNARISSSDIHFDNDPDEEASDHCWFDEDSDSDYASGIPENVHVPNDRNVTLILMGRATNGGKVKIEEELSKGLAGAVAGAALAMSPGLKAGFDKVNPPPAPKVQQVKPATAPEEQAQFKQAVQQAAPKWTPDGLHPWLIPIAHLESSFGQNMNHTPNSKGTYHTAYGPVGFKVSTAHEEWKKTKQLKDKFPGLEDPADFDKAFKSNWQLYNLLASSHFLRLAHRHGSNEKAAYAWRWGTGAASGAQDEVVNKDNYVQRYRDLLASTGVQKPQPKTEPIAKAISSNDLKPWNFSNGVKIPRGGTPERKTWDKAHFDMVLKYFARGDKTKIRKIKIPVSEHLLGHFINQKGAVGQGGRNSLPGYMKMLRGGDKVPPLVVRRNGISHSIIDGNSRMTAALNHGQIKELDAYELL